jgi:hypothetical protein
MTERRSREEGSADWESSRRGQVLVDFPLALVKAMVCMVGRGKPTQLQTVG